MPKRHQMIAGDWESVFGRLQELVLANSGEDDFQEIFKLVVAKLYSESSENPLDRFGPSEDATATARGVNQLLVAATKRWPGILPSDPRSLLDDEHLHVCAEALAGHHILDSSLEVMDNAFEYLMSRTAKGSKGQYFTPRHVVDACIKIIKPRPEELVADPACGSGGFLVHALLHVLEHHPDLDRADFSASHLWGFDFDQRAVEVARALMLLAGDGQSNIVRLNSLLTPELLNQLDVFRDGSEDPRFTAEDVMRTRVGRFAGFDVIVTNPPFAGEVKERDLLATYELAQGRTERDILFLERCFRLLKPGGRLAIVLPHNKYGGSQWARARDWLLRRMRVVAVLGLGRNTFQPHTAQKASVLFAQKRHNTLSRPLRDENILFLISEREGKDSRGRIMPRDGTAARGPLWERADHDLADCVAAFDQFARAEQLRDWIEN